MAGSPSAFSSQVFVNCPFDDDYIRLLRPLLFTLIDLGLCPRIASDRFDSFENRVDKICGLIRSCRFSIHDLSRLKASKADEYYRLNMPFELGIDYGLRLFGNGTYRTKALLILEGRRYDFQKALSDLAGVDVKCHNGEPGDVVLALRNWFVECSHARDLPSASQIWYRFTDFASDFYDSRKAKGFNDKDLNMMPVPEYLDEIADWIASHPLGSA